MGLELVDVAADAGGEIVDLEGRVVQAPGFEEPFAFDNFARYRLLNGLDDIALTLTHEDDLEAFELEVDRDQLADDSGVVDDERTQHRVSEHQRPQSRSRPGSCTLSRAAREPP